MSFQEHEYKKSLEVTMVHSIIQENLRSSQKIGGFQHTTKALARKAKKYKFCIKLGDKIQLGVWMYCDPFRWFSGGPGGKALEKFIIFSLKLL